MKNLPVPDDFLGTHGKAHKQRYNDAHEYICRDVYILAEAVGGRKTFPGKWEVLHNIGQDKRQHRCFQQIDDQVLLVDNFCEKIPRGKDLELPEGCLIALVHREGEILVPQGSLVLNRDDHLTIIGYPEGIQSLYDKFGRII